MYFGHHPGAPARREEHLLGDALARELGDDVDRAVADPDDEHALAAEDRAGRSGRCSGGSGSSVRRSVPGKLRAGRVPVVAVADEQRVEALRRRCPDRRRRSRVGVLHRRCRSGSARAARTRRRTRAASVDLGVVREVGIALVHREVAERDRALGGVDVQRAVGRRAAVRVPEVPVAADLVGGLEAGVVDADSRASALPVVRPLTPAPMMATLTRTNPNRLPRRHAVLRVRGPRDRQARRASRSPTTASPRPRRRARSPSGSAARPSSSRRC